MKPAYKKKTKKLAAPILGESQLSSAQWELEWLGLLLAKFITNKTVARCFELVRAVP